MKAAKNLLQGYSVLGRQLKIDFSSRDKGAASGNIDTAADAYRAPTVENFLKDIGDTRIMDFLNKFQVIYTKYSRNSQ